MERPAASRPLADGASRKNRPARTTYAMRPPCGRRHSCHPPLATFRPSSGPQRPRSQAKTGPLTSVATPMEPVEQEWPLLGPDPRAYLRPPE